MLTRHPSPAVRAAERYVQIATADGKGKLADLFQDDAVFYDPDGGITRGRESIRAFYDHKLADNVPSFHISRMASTDLECWVELSNGDPSEPELISTDHFTVGDDGLITRLAVFLRPRNQTG